MNCITQTKSRSNAELFPGQALPAMQALPGCTSSVCCPGSVVFAQAQPPHLVLCVFSAAGNARSTNDFVTWSAFSSQMLVKVLQQCISYSTLQSPERSTRAGEVSLVFASSYIGYLHINPVWLCGFCLFACLFFPLGMLVFLMWIIYILKSNTLKIWFMVPLFYYFILTRLEQIFFFFLSLEWERKGGSPLEEPAALLTPSGQVTPVAVGKGSSLPSAMAKYRTSLRKRLTLCEWWHNLGPGWKMPAVPAQLSAGHPAPASSVLPPVLPGPWGGPKQPATPTAAMQISVHQCLPCQRSSWNKIAPWPAFIMSKLWLLSSHSADFNESHFGEVNSAKRMIFLVKPKCANVKFWC